MPQFIITTDTTSDLPETYIKENKITVLPLTYMLDGVTYDENHTLSIKEFYDKMRHGAMPTTSQINPEEAKEIFQTLLEEKDMDILHIAFSSGLSGSYNSARMAADELMEQTTHKIVVIDSLCASMGEGLLVHKAAQLQQKGKSLEEVAEWLENNKLHICHNFTVMDLNHLYRGGRVSKTAAILGTMAKVKPVLHVDDEGHLIPLAKVRGRKKSLLTLVDNMEQQMGSYVKENQEDMVFIGHGDAKEDALYVAELVKERFGIQRFLINDIGPVIGTHTGADVITLFFIGEKR